MVVSYVSLGNNRIKAQHGFGSNPQLWKRQGTLDTMDVPSKSLPMHWWGELCSLFSVSLWTHYSLLKSVRNYHNSLSQSVIIFVKRYVAHEGFSVSPGFSEEGKGKRFLTYYCWVALSSTSKWKNTSVATGNYILKVFLFWSRKLSLKWWSLTPSV